MRVRIAYTVVVNDEYRRAINHHYGMPGMATREEIKAWFEANGEQASDTIMYELACHESEDDDD